MTQLFHDPEHHYDRVTPAWSLLLGDDLHYGVFRSGGEKLETATGELTRLMAEAALIEPGVSVLDVGCGTGSTACVLAANYGASVTAITTSQTGVEATRARAAAVGVQAAVRCERRDGMDNGLPDESFDRVWVLESSHLMRARDKLIQECARVLRPRGRIALCDIMLRRPMALLEVRRQLEPLTLLREVFGDARMEPRARYAELMRAEHLAVDQQLDLTDVTRPTFGRWRKNAQRHREALIDLLGERQLERFVAACVLLERLWDDGTLGYGLLAARKCR